MPTIHIDIIEGRTLDQKRALVKGITEVVQRTCQVDAQRVTIYINEIKKEHAGKAGLLRIDEEKQK